MLRQNEFLFLASLDFIIRASFTRTCSLVGEVMKAELNIAGISMYLSYISSLSFNLNVFSDIECFVYFRFIKEHVGIIAELTGWTAGVTQRSIYACNALKETCILLRPLSLLAR